MIVAIDGPAGAGKSTIARRVAAKIGAVYIDTGAMYRAVALLALRSGIDLADASRLEPLARGADIRFEAGNSRVLLNGEDVTEAIRNPEVSPAASKISAIPGVRRVLVEKQRSMGAAGSVVMEGRDIGTVVFPDADAKFFLTASAEVRGRRRHAELAAKGDAATLEQVLADQERRDRDDSTRSVAPLRPAEDAVRVDTSGLALDAVVDRLAGEVAARLVRQGRSG